jgi:RNA polymerase sigma-70 factor (ECF subfamily)
MKTLSDALERIYREYRQQLFSCALAVTRCPERAEDAVHDAFSRLFRLNIRPRNLKVYVFRAVRNAAIDQIRRNPLPPDAWDTFIFEPSEGPREMAARDEFKQRAAKALLTVSDDERETIVQHLYADLTFREIARLRGAPAGTVAAWYYRGLKKLRARLED